MKVSDRICLEHGLSVIRNPKKAPSRPVWEDEKAGKPTRYNIYREDICKAMYGSRRMDLMVQYLQRLGYDVDFTSSKWKIKLHKYRYFTHLETLNPEWTSEYIRKHLGLNTRYGNRRAEVRFSPYSPEKCWEFWAPGKRTTHIYRLYIWWQYQLGILPHSRGYEPTSPFIREELRKLDSLDAQTRYMAANKIETLDDLHADLAATEAELKKQEDIRRRLQNKIRRATPEKKEEYRAEKAKVTEAITALRKRRKLAIAIEERSIRIDTALEQLMANEDAIKHRAQMYSERNFTR